MITSDRWTCPRCQHTYILITHDTAQPARDVEYVWQRHTRDTHRCRS